MAVIPRAATPLSVLLAIAFGLQLVSVISVPIVDSITLSVYQNVKFGVFGYCTASGCSSVRVGYPDSITSDDGDDFSLPSNARHSLTNLLIVHPIAAGFTLILLILSLIAHFPGPGNSPRYLFFLLIFCLPTFILSLLAFLVDILLFIPHMAWGGWIVLGATVVIALASLILCTMRRTLSSRKAMHKRIFDNADLEGPTSLRLNPMQFYPPGTTADYGIVDDQQVLIYDGADGKTAKLESTVSHESSLSPHDSGLSGDVTLNNTPEHLQEQAQTGRAYTAVNQISPGQEYGRVNAGPEYTRANTGSPRIRPPRQVNSRAGYQNVNGPYGNMPDPYGEYPRDRLPRTTTPRAIPTGRRPPYAVVMPPATSDGTTEETPMESYVTARSEPFVEGGSSEDISQSYPDVDLPMAGTPVSRNGTPLQTSGAAVPAERIASPAQDEYVGPRQAQAWQEDETEGGDRPARQRLNSKEYYDDIDPQYSEDAMSPTNQAYMQTVSPISLPSARSPYSEFRPPMPQQYSSGQYQRRGPRVAMPVSPAGGPYASRPMYPQEYPQARATPNSPDGSVSSHLTSVSQRGINPRYYQPQGQPPVAPPVQQRRLDRTEMMLRANPDFELAGVRAGRRGPKPPQAPTLMGGRDSPFTKAQQPGFR